MESEIWRIQTERIGTLESFRSERDMESFLMSNPAVLGCWDPRSKIPKPTLLMQQINLKLEGDTGRIDLIGIGNREGDFELRIFELKIGNITAEAVDQSILTLVRLEAESDFEFPTVLCGILYHELLTFKDMNYWKFYSNDGFKTLSNVKGEWKDIEKVGYIPQNPGTEPRSKK